MLFDNGFNNRIDTKKAFDYTHFVKYASDYLFASSRARRLARLYVMLLDLSSRFYLIVFFFYYLTLQDLSVVSCSDTRE